MMMSTISMADGYERSKLRSQEARKANTIWDDDDFSQLNNFCAKNLLVQPTNMTRIVRTWMEEWERQVFTSAGDEKFAVRLSAKYEGLKWYDEDKKWEMRTMDGYCVVLCKLTSAHQTGKPLQNQIPLVFLGVPPLMFPGVYLEWNQKYGTKATGDEDTEIDDESNYDEDDT